MLTDLQIKLMGDSAWLIVRTYNLPGPPSHQFEQGIKAAGDFLEAHREHPYAVVAAWWIAETYRRFGRSDDAVAAYQKFIAGEGYRLPGGDAATDKLELMGKSPAILQGEKSDQKVLKDLKEKLDDGDVFHGKTFNYRKDGSEFIMEWKIVPIHGEEGVISHYLAIQREVADTELTDGALDTKLPIF